MPEYVWYPRLGAISGLNYQTPPGIDRSKLRLADMKPKISQYNFDGKLHLAAMWGNTSQAPASSYLGESDFQRAANEKELSAFLHRFHESLELPGTANDYHFLIGRAQYAMWSNRRLASWALDQCERLCWLDIALVEAAPHDNEQDEDLRTLGQSSWPQLISLYTREGYLLEAAEVAERGAAFLRPPPPGRQYNMREELGAKAQEIRSRIAAIEATSG